MTDQEYADIVLAEIAARAETQADPNDTGKFNVWNIARLERRKELRNRQDRSYAEKYPPVQFERDPNEGLL